MLLLSTKKILNFLHLDNHNREVGIGRTCSVKSTFISVFWHKMPLSHNTNISRPSRLQCLSTLSIIYCFWFQQFLHPTTEIRFKIVLFWEILLPPCSIRHRIGSTTRSWGSFQGVTQLSWAPFMSSLTIYVLAGWWMVGWGLLLVNWLEWSKISKCSSSRLSTCGL